MLLRLAFIVRRGRPADAMPAGDRVLAMIGNVLTRSLARLVWPGGRRARLAILIYHRVLPRCDAINTWDVTADEFEAQMGALAANFSLLPLSEAIERLGKGSLGAKSACVTFDDGYADNAEVALPILQRYSIPATFFIAAGYIDGGRMWNDTVIEAIRTLPGPRLELNEWGMGSFALDSDAARRTAIGRILPAFKYLASAEREARASHLAAMAGISPRSELMLSESQICMLHAAGMEIGAHTMTHPILANSPAEQARQEIIEGGRRLSEIVRTPVKLFAYPNGKPRQDYTAEHVRMVCEAGYSAAVSTSRGSATRACDVFQLPRFTPWDRAPGRFTLRLLQNVMLAQPESV